MNIWINVNFKKCFKMIACWLGPRRISLSFKAYSSSAMIWMMSCIFFSTSTLFIQNVESLTNEHIHSHILHTVKLLIFHVNISHRYLYCCLILCQNKCECILAVDCYQDCSAPPPISTPTVCQKLDYYCQKSGDDYHRVQRYLKKKKKTATMKQIFALIFALTGYISLK